MLYIIYVESASNHGYPHSLGPFRTYISLLEHLVERLEDDLNFFPHFLVEMRGDQMLLQRFTGNQLDGSELARLQALGD